MVDKSKKELVVERLKARFPDANYDDDETIFGQIDTDYSENEKSINSFKAREQALNDLFTKDPQSAQFITDMAKGNNPLVAMIERIGVDGFNELLNDPNKREEFSEANAKYLERVSREKDLESEWDKNFSASMESLDQIKAEEGLDDATVDSAMELIWTIANEAVLGKYSPETIKMAVKAVSHDTDVDEARLEGEVAGRNAKITEKLRKKNSGDGVPALAGSNNIPNTDNQRTGSLFDLARNA